MRVSDIVEPCNGVSPRVSPALGLIRACWCWVINFHECTALPTVLILGKLGMVRAGSLGIWGCCIFSVFCEPKNAVKWTKLLNKHVSKEDIEI